MSGINIPVGPKAKAWEKQATAMVFLGAVMKQTLQPTVRTRWKPVSGAWSRTQACAAGEWTAGGRVARGGCGDVLRAGRGSEFATRPRLSGGVPG